MTVLEIVLMAIAVLMVGTIAIRRDHFAPARLSEGGEWSVWGLIVSFVVFAALMGVTIWVISLLTDEQAAVKKVADACGVAEMSDPAARKKCLTDHGITP